jgi:hypothetical protein
LCLGCTLQLALVCLIPAKHGCLCLPYRFKPPGRPLEEFHNALAPCVVDPAKKIQVYSATGHPYAEWGVKQFACCGVDTIVLRLTKL